VKLRSHDRVVCRDVHVNRFGVEIEIGFSRDAGVLAADFSSSRLAGLAGDLGFLSALSPTRQS
jgi:hypothetical protein